MPPQACPAAEPAIGLPSVDDPRLNLQFVGRKPLNSHPVKEPGSVGRHIRWLVSPVIEVVVAEQSNVGHENSRIQIEAVVHIPVVASVCLGHVLIRTAKIPLSPSRAGVIAWRRDAEHSIHGQNPAANVLPMEVAAEADLFHLDFVRPKNLARSAQRVILGVVKTTYKVRVEPDLWSEELG